MVKVLKTNSGYYVAFKEDVTLTTDEILSYKTADYNDPQIEAPFIFKEKFPKADAPLTRALMTEIKDNIPEIERSINELADDSNFRKHVLEIAQRTGRQHCYTHYTIQTSDLPSDYATCHIPLRRKEEFYFPKYDSKQQRYICCNETGHEIKINSTRASFDFKKMEVSVYDKAFFFTPQERNAIKQINQLVQKHPLNDVLKKQPKQIQALYKFYLDIYKHYLDKNQKIYSVSHELQHAQTQQRINQRCKQPNHRELSPTNYYRFDEDNEKAAHLRETYLAISKFFQKGGDISVFPRKCQWLTDKIKNLSFEKQKEILLNNNFIVNGNIQNWNRYYAATYVEQRCIFTQDHAEKASILRMEDGDEEYLARRSCAYTMDVYNPQTQKMEKQDLSKFIQIPTIIRDTERKYVEQYEAIRHQRLNMLKQNGIDLKLILSLFNETYQEPFKSNTSKSLQEQILKKGISFKSKNTKGDSILITAEKHSSSDRPNCIFLSGNLNGQQTFSFTLDQDKKEYIFYDYNNRKKYSNAAGTKHSPLPEAALQQIRKYMKEAFNIVALQIQKISQGKDPHE